MPRYTASDIHIVGALGTYGPRNILKISRILGIPEATIRYRIRRLRDKGLLYLHTNIYHTNLGLKKTILFAKFNPDYESYMNDFLSIVDYWVYLKKVHGNKNMYHALYISPVEYMDELRRFIREMEKLDIIKEPLLLNSTCFHNVNPSSDWYDLKQGVWTFNWDTLEDEIDNASEEVPFTLEDPKGYPMLGDWHDIMILKELEKDATRSYHDIAKMLNTTPQNIFYHYKKHIVGRRLIEDFQVFLLKFPMEVSYYIHAILEFSSRSMLRKVANAFRNKPFTNVLGKIIGEDKLYCVMTVPSHQFVNLFNKLDELVAEGYISDYQYWVAHYLDWWRRQTIAYKNYVDGRWSYPHEEYMNELYRIHEDAKKKIIERYKQTY
jgi:DNA-binding Lrp family transcriptional regulator